MIAKSIAERVLLCAMSTGADFVELFAEKTRTSSISLADAKIEAIRDNTISGVGIRAFVGTKTIFAFRSFCFCLLSCFSAPQGIFITSHIGAITFHTFQIFKSIRLCRHMFLQ